MHFGASWSVDLSNLRDKYIAGEFRTKGAHIYGGPTVDALGRVAKRTLLDATVELPCPCQKREQGATIEKNQARVALRLRQSVASLYVNVPDPAIKDSWE